MGSLSIDLRQRIIYWKLNSKTKKEIAHILCLNVRTVKKYWKWFHEYGIAKSLDEIYNIKHGRKYSYSLYD